MITHLDSRQTQAAQRLVHDDPARVDRSPNGGWSVQAQGDSVVLTQATGTRVVKTAAPVIEASVADDGALVARVEGPDKKQRLERLEPDGRWTVLDPDIHTRSVDISADGTQVASAECYDVRVFDASGTSRRLAKMPVFIDEVEYLPGGRLLARGTSNGWGGASAPAFFTIDPASGSYDFLADVKEVAALGVDVHGPLLEQIDHAYPNTTPEQRALILDAHGYQLPHYRTISPDARRMVFEMKPLAQDPAQGSQGLYFFVAGRDLPVPLNDPSGVLGGRGLDSTVWSPSTRRAAVVLGGSDAQMLAVALDDGAAFRPLPLNVDGKHVHWSADEQRLAFDVRDGERRIVYVYDVPAGHFFPVVPDASVEGWDGPRLRVHRPDGTSAVLAASPLDPEQGVELVLGGPRQTSPGTVKVDGDHVDINGIRIPRRASHSAS